MKCLLQRNILWGTLLMVSNNEKVSGDMYSLDSTEFLYDVMA